MRSQDFYKAAALKTILSNYLFSCDQQVQESWKAVKGYRWKKKIVMDEFSFSFLWTVMLMIVMFVNLNSVSGARAKDNREGNAAVVPDGGAIKAPAQGAIAGTFDPNYQTMAGLGNDVFGADKGGAGAGGVGGGASPVAPRVSGPIVPVQ
ncbi:unnamed protein product, partial [Brugia timori]|uniref:Neur_chan_memb domain-containing protein n=1 Tax=Brugia timori TaxID=42155 RepID=A0A0R3R8N8_9BILA